jgi:pimeloyl-ACP methyl ester carboxylesterase
MTRSRQTEERRSVRLEQGEIRYREYGAGAPVVFVHGLLVNGKLWRKVVPALAREHRCIVPDLPLGSHETPMAEGADLTPLGLARLVVDFVDALGLDRVTLVGNDTGGAICQIVAAEHPERVASLVLTNCDAFDCFPPKEFAPLVLGARVPGFLWELAQALRLDAVRRSPLAYGWLTKRPVDGALLDEWLRPLIASGEIRRDVAAVLRGISPRYTLEAAEKLRSFPRPVLIAWAPEDRFFKFAHAVRLASLLPDARLETIDDSRTFVPEDQPERLASLIGAFLAERRSVAAAS